MGDFAQITIQKIGIFTRLAAESTDMKEKLSDGTVISSLTDESTHNWMIRFPTEATVTFDYVVSSSEKTYTLYAGGSGIGTISTDELSAEDMKFIENELVL